MGKTPRSHSVNIRYRAVGNECYALRMTTLNPVLNALVIVCSVVGLVGILFGVYLFLVALPELPRYVRIKTM